MAPAPVCHEPKTSLRFTRKVPRTKSGPPRPPARGPSLPKGHLEVIRSDRCVSQDHTAKCGHVP